VPFFHMPAGAHDVNHSQEQKNKNKHGDDVKWWRHTTTNNNNNSNRCV